MSENESKITSKSKVEMEIPLIYPSGVLYNYVLREKCRSIFGSFNKTRSCERIGWERYEYQAYSDDGYPMFILTFYKIVSENTYSHLASSG